MSEPTYIDKLSFLFGSTDMYQEFGITLLNGGIPEDVLMPTLRPRKVTLPLRNGVYDYGAKYYDERHVEVSCITVKAGTRDDAREMAYVLSKKSQIRFWHEPDKYYVGRIYSAPNLDILRKVGNTFKLDFTVEPFAYGSVVETSFTNRRYTPNYKGTAPTPTYIVIENTGSGNAVNIQISQSIKRG